MINLQNIRSAYFIGIKGVGMTALAQIFKARGIRVSGSDTADTFFTDKVLKRLEIPVQEGFSRKNLPQKVNIVVSSAAYFDRKRKPTHPEVIEALRRRLALFTYPEIVARLFDFYEGIAVAGTHGKSTTTAMLGEVLEALQLDPTVIVGTMVKNWRSNARAPAQNISASPRSVRVGQRLVRTSPRLLVVEADEYRSAFLRYQPRYVVLTAVEYDHPDFFKNPKDYDRAFVKLIQNIPESGYIVACGDDKGVRRVLKQARPKLDKSRIIFYGFGSKNHVRLSRYKAGNQGCNFVIAYSPALARGHPQILKNLRMIRLRFPGRHYALDATAALAMAIILLREKRGKIDFRLIKSIEKTLSNFAGTARRFEIMGRCKGALIIDDYAHHPGEIAATLAAARQAFPKKKIKVLFHPHTFSRTQALLNEFAKAFSDSDEALVLDIYGSAREKAGTIHSRDLVAKIKKYHKNVRYLGSFVAAIDYLRDILKPRDILIVMGAGDVWKAGAELVARSPKH